HEFKTPLSGILTSISLIEKYNESIINENIQNHAFKIKKLVFQLNSVLDDFLFLEKTETKNLKYQLTKFNFCEFIDEIIENSRSVLKKGQTIKLTQCDSKIEVIQDKKIVDIIIRNILFNSIKYSPENSNIKINITNNSYLKIIVQDNGIGIPKKDQKHIFERFFRAKNALHFQGTGIGLNIVKHHIEELKGSIKFISEEKKGSTFTIKLPLIMKL
ncbi:MAG: HAMP domain-containing histidine kinase, partial [Flavobacteriaceae bacterium]|nr:HAMP domain-containing histidine kinase [Flavobacteriaceae bacterium]